MSRYLHIMVDIETLARSEFARILTIGACVFDPETRAVTSRFYVPLTAPENEAIVTDPDTVAWWEKQKESPAYNEALNNPNAVAYDQALTNFANWVMGQRELAKAQETCMWANDPDFDMKILLGSFTAYNLLAPWQFWEHKSCRTMEAIGRMFNIIRKRDFKRTGTHHNALDDAIYQASYVSAIWDAVHTASKLTVKEPTHG